MPNTNAAVQANIESLKNVMAGNKEAWLDLFAPEGVVHDPVGRSPHDPEGHGFRGRQRIGEFWDMMIATGDLNIVAHKRIAVGDRVACVIMTACNNAGGLKAHIEMVGVYEVNADGLIESLKVYWDVDALMAQLGG